MLKRIDLMNNWFFKNEYTEGMEQSRDISGFTKVQLPHTNIELPYQYFDEEAFQFVSCYKYFFESPVLSENQVAKICFEGVMTYAKVYLNGQYLGEHKGGYTPFSFAVQDFLLDSLQNEITVIVDSTERADIPPFGDRIDYLTYGGIYREVSLDIFEAVHIANAKIDTLNVLTDKKDLQIDVMIENTQEETSGILDVSILDSAGAIIFETSEVLTCPSGPFHYDHVFHDVENGAKSIRLWSISDPALYTVKLCLHTGLRIDSFERRIGFRTIAFTTGGFFLNGEKIQLRGLNRHQSWPYVGYAMPKRAQRQDADILKNDLHLNMVRTSHYPQSIHFLDRCDEIGLLVLEELPGWQHIGDEAWKEVANTNVSEMIERDWNHPSIFLWGVRINESQDDHDFYVKTNGTSHMLDSTRPTGGIRYIRNSELLEDVYTMNDFGDPDGKVVVHDPKENTGLDHDVPYMITEYCGHMYPTKKFDCEERQMEHVSRHLRIQNEAHANPHIAGAVGWCAFDYNTHKDFGAGDRICYHGVMDMFRIKKFAAYVYKSQVSPEIEPVLIPVTFWARGERSVGGVLPLTVLTNCDSITIQYGNSEPIPVTQKSDDFKSLPYPPFVIDSTNMPADRLGEWGMCWESGIISGFVDGRKVIEKKFAKDPLPTHFSAVPDDTKLDRGSKDVTRVLVSISDQEENVLPFADTIVRVSISGPARIQGPDCFALKGGSIGFYIESNGEPGTLHVLVESDGFEPQKFDIEVC